MISNCVRCPPPRADELASRSGANACSAGGRFLGGFRTQSDFVHHERRDLKYFGETREGQVQSHYGRSLAQVGGDRTGRERWEGFVNDSESKNTCACNADWFLPRCERQVNVTRLPSQGTVHGTRCSRREDREIHTSTFEQDIEVSLYARLIAWSCDRVVYDTNAVKKSST